MLVVSISSVQFQICVHLEQMGSPGQAVGFIRNELLLFAMGALGSLKS